MTNEELKKWRKGATKRPVPQSFYDSRAWQMTRIAVLARDGFCQIREKCQGAVAICVDHKIPAKLRPDLALDMNYLQAACAACNSWKQHDDKRRWAELTKLAATIPRPGPITF
jgi:5-methylcytosine-specific restriction endonuclease McrA